MRLIGAPVLAIVFTWLTGCSNALYFYETENLAMSLEGRPDSSQPLQGSLGLKQRVAVVVPPEDPDTMTKAKGEALSMISSFRFRKDPGTLRDIGPVTIQTAFVTGKAAKLLEPDEAEQIAQAIAQGQVASEAIATEGEIANRFVRKLKKPGREGDLQTLRDLLAAGCKDLTLSSQTKFKNITGTVRFRESLCNAVRQRLETNP